MKKNNQEISEMTESIYYGIDDHQYVVTSAPEVGILKSLGIGKDAIIRKKMTYKMGGPVLLMVGSSVIAIGKDIAEKIMVRR